MRALVIDDSNAMRMILTQLLTPLGFEVSEAGHGQEALDLLKGGDVFDLALVDWNMPVMNGIDFIVAVRSDRRFDEMRLLVVTSQTEVEQIRASLEAGADEFLMKPFTKDSLVGKLELLHLEVS